MFQWDKFLFVANATLKFNMKLKDDAKLPSGRADAKLIDRKSVGRERV